MRKVANRLLDSDGEEDAKKQLKARSVRFDEKIKRDDSWIDLTGAINEQNSASADEETPLIPRGGVISCGVISGKENRKRKNSSIEDNPSGFKKQTIGDTKGGKAAVSPTSQARLGVADVTTITTPATTKNVLEEKKAPSLSRLWQVARLGVYAYVWLRKRRTGIAASHPLLAFANGRSVQPFRECIGLPPRVEPYERAERADIMRGKGILRCMSFDLGIILSYSLSRHSFDLECVSANADDETEPGAPTFVPAISRISDSAAMLSKKQQSSNNNNNKRATLANVSELIRMKHSTIDDIVAPALDVATALLGKEQEEQIISAFRRPRDDVLPTFFELVHSQRTELCDDEASYEDAVAALMAHLAVFFRSGEALPDVDAVIIEQQPPDGKSARPFALSIALRGWVCGAYEVAKQNGRVARVPIIVMADSRQKLNYLNGMGIQLRPDQSAADSHDLNKRLSTLGFHFMLSQLVQAADAEQVVVVVETVGTAKKKKKAQVATAANPDIVNMARRILATSVFSWITALKEQHDVADTVFLTLALTHAWRRNSAALEKKKEAKTRLSRTPLSSSQSCGGDNEKGHLSTDASKTEAQKKKEGQLLKVLSKTPRASKASTKTRQHNLALIKKRGGDLTTLLAAE